MNRLITTGIITIAILMNAPEAQLEETSGMSQLPTSTQIIEIKASKIQPSSKANQISANKSQPSLFDLNVRSDLLTERDRLVLEQFLIKIVPSQQQ